MFDIASGRNVVTGLCAPHSPRYFDGAWTVCDSLRESVVQVDATGRRKREAKLRSFTRGLAVTDDYIVVGESVQRGTDDALATGAVAVLRRSDFSFVARLEVPFREVSEVVVVPRVLADAVRTGFRTNPLRVGESDQLQMFRAVGIEPRRLWAVSERLSAEAMQGPDSRTNSELVSFVASLHWWNARFGISPTLFCVPSFRFPLASLTDGRAPMTPPQWPAAMESEQPFPACLPPGMSIHCRMEVLAPDSEGEFEIVVTLVQEHVAWFSDMDASNGCWATVSVKDSLVLSHA